MIVSCPACEGRFEVDQEQLGYDGRVVRCGKCGNCWHQMPDNDPRAAVAAAEAAPPPPRRRAAAPAPKKKSRAALVGWVLLLLLLGTAVAGGWLERQRIVEQFPQLADVYALIGVPVEPPGPVFKLSEVNLDREVVEGDTVIVVRGVVANISERKQAVPALRAQLTNGAGEVLTEWTFQAPQSELDAGGSVAFETETKNPPDGARDLNISIVDGADGAH